LKPLTQYLSIAIILSIMVSVSALLTTYINNVYESALSVKGDLLDEAIILNKLELDKNKIIIVEFNREAMVYDIIVIYPLTKYSYSILKYIGNGTSQISYNNMTIFYQNMTNLQDKLIGIKNSLIIMIVPRDLCIKIYSTEGVYCA